MVFVFAGALLLAGYTLIDWGHYAVQNKHVSLWYLVSGQRPVKTGSNTPSYDPTNNRITQGWQQTPGHNLPGAPGPRGH